MTILCIILGIISGILLFLLILNKCEIKNISDQLGRIDSHDTNELVHASGSDKDTAELINNINLLLREVQSSRIEYQSKSRALEKMMTNISHDLRTPLTSAMGYINMVRSSDMTQEEKKREIEIIEKRLIRLEELINSFFEFSKIISSDKPPETEALNLTAVLEESVVHYYDDYCARGRSILLSCGKTKLDIVSNKNMLMRIFDNLIGNALKHGTGDLSISVEESGGISIRFENPLIGSDIDIDRIFDEFYTTDISRTKGNTGLGLAIAKQFTQMLGGGISADYDGEIFSVTLVLSNA